MKNFLLNSFTACLLLTFGFNSFAGTVRVPFETSSTSISVLKNSTSVVDMGTWAVGMIAYKTIVYSNTSNVRANITNIDTDPGLELVEGGCSTLNAGESCSMTFSYLVSSEGASSPNARLYVTTSEGSVSNTFTMLVNGVPSTSVLTISPSSANFSYAGETKTFQITNTQPFAVPAGTISVTNKNWTISSNTCASGEIAEGATCTVTAKFIATKTGSNSGAINVLVNTIPFATASITGSIIYGYPSFDLTQLEFKGSVANKLISKSVTLKNTGQGKLVINNVSYTGDNIFQLGSNLCPAVLEPGASCNVEVKATFPPNKTAQGSVAFNFSNSGQSIAYAGVTGDSNQANKALSLSPSPLSFETVLPGATATASVTLTSVGADPVVVGTLSNTGANVALSQKQNCEGITLAAGQSCSFTATFTAPATEGTSTGAITATSDAATVTTNYTATTAGTTLVATPSPVSITGVDNGSASQTVTLKNTSLYDSTVSDVSLSNTNYSISANTCLNKVVKAGLTCSFVVTPSSAGSSTASISVTYSSGTVNKNLSIPVSSKITAQGLKFDSFSCPSPVLAKAGVCTALLSNKGTSSVTVTSLTVDSKSYGTPSLQGASLPYVLAAGASATVNLPYTISQEGSYLATVTAKNSVSDVTSSASVILTAGVTATLSNFTCPDPVLVGDAPVCTATLANTGTKTFLIGSVKADNASFVATHTCSTQLLAAKSCVISVKVPVTQIAAISGNVTVSGSLTLSKPINITPKQVSFEVTEPAPISTALNTAVTGLVKYKNISGFSVNLTNAIKTVTGSGFSLVSTTCSGVIANNATCTITFKFMNPSALTNSKGQATLSYAGQAFVGNLTGSASMQKISVVRKAGLTSYVGFKSYSGNSYVVTNNSLTAQTISSMGGSPHPILVNSDGCRIGVILQPGQSCEFYDYVNNPLKPESSTKMAGTREIATKEGLKASVSYDYTMASLVVALKSTIPILNIGEVHNNSITIANSAMVTLNNIRVTPSAVKSATFELGNPSCLTKLMPGQSCEVPFTVRANTKTPGDAMTWTVTGAYNKERNGVAIGLGDNAVQYVLGARITAEEPNANLIPAVYPSTPIGTTQFATHTFTNTGRTAITVQDVTITDPESLQNIVEDKCKGTVVNPGANCTIKTSSFAKPDVLKYPAADLKVFDSTGKFWKATLTPNVPGMAVIDIENTYCRGGVRMPVAGGPKLSLTANQGALVACRVSIKNVGGGYLKVGGVTSFKESVGPDGSKFTAPFGEEFFGFVPVTELTIADFLDKYMPKGANGVSYAVWFPGTNAKVSSRSTFVTTYEDNSYYNSAGGGYGLAPGAVASFILSQPDVRIGGGKELTLAIYAADPYITIQGYKMMPTVAKFSIKFNVKRPNLVASSNLNYPTTNLTSGQSVTTIFRNDDIERLPIVMDSTGVLYPSYYNTIPYLGVALSEGATVNDTKMTYQYRDFASNLKLVYNPVSNTEEFVTFDTKTGFIQATTCTSKRVITESSGSSRWTTGYVFAEKGLYPGETCQVRRSCLVDTQLNISVPKQANPLSSLYTKDASGNYFSTIKISDYLKYGFPGAGLYGVANEVLYSNSPGFFYNQEQRTAGLANPYIDEYYSIQSNPIGRYGYERIVSNYSMAAVSSNGGSTQFDYAFTQGITQFPVVDYPLLETKKFPVLTCQLPKGWVQ